MNKPAFTFAAAVLALAASLPAVAAEGVHAAPVMSKPAAGIDASTFIVGHPASPTWKAPVHVASNGQHPAVLVSRQAAHIDTNTFLVQPPASTVWTRQSAADVAVVAGTPVVNAR